MTDPELVALAVRMREAQKRYFADRSQQALQESKDLERRFDQAAAERKAGPSLFDREEGEP
jgi:hypothetical protein